MILRLKMVAQDLTCIKQYHSHKPEKRNVELLRARKYDMMSLQT